MGLYRGRQQGQVPVTWGGERYHASYAVEHILSGLKAYLMALDEETRRHQTIEGGGFSSQYDQVDHHPADDPGALELTGTRINFLIRLSMHTET